MTAVIDGIGRENLEDASMIITIGKNGVIMAYSEDTATAIIFPHERSEKPYLEVWCHLDFVAYFARLLGVPIKFKGLNR